jgi:hypothetical protein
MRNQIISYGKRVDVIFKLQMTDSIFYVGVEPIAKNWNYVLLAHIPYDPYKAPEEQKEGATRQPVLIGYYGQSVAALAQGIRKQFLLSEQFLVPKATVDSLEEYLSWLKSVQEKFVKVVEAALNEIIEKQRRI